MKRGRPIHEPSAYRNGDAIVSVHQKKLLRPLKRRKCSRHSDCPTTALNVQRRVLRYDLNHKVLIIPNRRQISLEERNATWITMKAFRRMQKESAEMIERMEANSKHQSFSSLSVASDLDPPPITPSSSTVLNSETRTANEKSTLIPSSPSSKSEDGDIKGNGDESANESDICLRGLEQHTKLYLATKLSVQRLMHETVEKIRKLEAQDHKEYGNVLAQLCQVCSATAIENARVLGERDAQEAAAYHAEK